MTLSTNPRLADYLDVLSAADYLHQLRKKWWLVACCGLLGLASGLAYCKYNPDQYVSRAILRFIPQQVSDRYVQANESMLAEQRANALSQTLSSTLTARKMIEGIGLYPELRRFWTTADLVDRFQKDLSVSSAAHQGASGRGIPSVQISFRSSDAAKAKRVTQQLVEIVYEANRRYRGDETLGTTDFLTTQAQAARKQLEELEAQLSELGGPDRSGGNYKWTLKVEQLHNLDNRMSQLQSTLRLLNRDRDERAQEIHDAEAQLRRVPSVISAETEPPSLELLGIRDSMHRASILVLQFAERYQPNHPDLVSAQLALSKLKLEAEAQQTHEVEAARNREKRRIRDRIEQLSGNLVALETTITARQREEITLNREIRDARAATAQSPQEDSEYLRVSREYYGIKEFYASLQRKMEESRVAAEMERVGRGEVIEMVEPPTTPGSAMQPIMEVKVLIGLCAGLGTGLLLVMYLLLLSPRIRHDQHLQLWAGAAPLARIPDVEDNRWIRIRRLPAGSGVVLALVLLLQACGGVRALSKDDYLKQGDAALKQRQYRAAILNYRNALKLDKRFGAAHERLSAVLLEVGEAEEAYPSLLRASELLPHDRRVQLRLADYTQRVYLGDPARPALALREVEDLAQKLTARWPAQPEGYRYLAFVLTERHRPEEAVSLLREALKKTGPDPSIICDLASIHHNQQRLDESRALLEDLLSARSPYEPAYDLLYLQLMEARLPQQAGAVLQTKWKVSGSVDSGLQYAAHLHATGASAAVRETIDRLADNPGPESDAWVRIGDFWMNRGEPQLARRAFERGAREQPKLRSVFVGRLVELNISGRKRDEARVLLDAELRSSPKDDTLSAYRAALDLDENSASTRAKARLELESILMRMPASAFVRYHLGRAYLRVGDTMRASAHLERCVRLDPNYAPGWLALAEADYIHGNLLRAQTRVGGLLARAPNHPGGLLLNARLHKSLGHLAEAETNLLAASKAGADHQELLLERAALELQRGRSEQALQLLRHEWDGAADDERHILLLARAEFAGNQRRAALDRLARELARSPKSTPIRELYAALLGASGDLPNALNQYSELRKSNPDRGQYALAVADLTALTGKVNDALAAYQVAGQAMPNNPNVWLRYAAVLTASGDAGAARNAYTKALSLDSSNPLTMNNLAYLLARSGQNLDYALQLAQEAQRALPQSLETLDTLTYVHLRAGMKRAALENFDRLIRTARPEDRTTLEASRDEVRRGELPQAARRMELARDNRAAHNGGARL